MAAPGVFPKVATDSVSAADYNAIQALIYNVKTVGLGVACVSSSVSAGATVTVAQWNNLKTDIDYCTNYYSLSVTPLGTPSTSIVMAASFFNQYYINADIVPLSGTVVFPTSAQWTVPQYANQATISISGGGGGGGGYHLGCNGTTTHPGGDGGAGETNTGVFSVIPGSAINVTVGSGGAGGDASVNGSSGGASSVTGGIISINVLGGGGGIQGTARGPGNNGTPSGTGPSGGLGGKNRDSDPDGKTGQSGEGIISWIGVKLRSW